MLALHSITHVAGCRSLMRPCPCLSAGWAGVMIKQWEFTAPLTSGYSDQRWDGSLIGLLTRPAHNTLHSTHDTQHITHDTHGTPNTLHISLNTWYTQHITHDTHNTSHITHYTWYTQHIALNTLHMIHTLHPTQIGELCKIWQRSHTHFSSHFVPILANLSLISIIGDGDTQINIGHLNLVFIVSDSITLSIINIFDSSAFYWLALTWHEACFMKTIDISAAPALQWQVQCDPVSVATNNHFEANRIIK